jgi:hypothetical protein
VERLDKKTFTVYSLSLFLLLVACYLLTYRGFPFSQDTYYIFDSVESLVRRGTLELTYEFAPDFSTPADGGAPWLSSPQEPFNMYLVAPFYWLGSQLAGVGTAHITWLFNIFMTAFTAVNFFWGALWLGYAPRISWMGGLLLGLTTLAWTYARFLFREPVMTFFLMWSFFAAVYVYRRWRAGQFSWGALALMIGMFALTFLSKEVAIAVLPALLLLLFPSVKRIKPKTIIIMLVAVAVLVVIFGILAISLNEATTRYSFDRWWQRLNTIKFDIMLESVLGYQISFSRSLWLHSPILLVGLVGLWTVFKRGEWRLVFAPILMTLMLSAAYVGYSYSWWGNWGWGPRYLLPLGPVWMVFVLEVLQHHRLTRPHRLMIGGLALAGALVQVIGMMPIPNFYTDMYFAGVLPELNQQTGWGAYNWQWNYSPIHYHLQNLSVANMDIAWFSARRSMFMFALLFGGVASTVAYAVWVMRSAKPKPITRQLLVGLGLLIAIFGLMVFGMRSLYGDDRYIEGRHDVRELITQMEQRVTPDQIVFVDRREYQHAFMNYFKTPAIVAIFPYAPGENYTSDPIDPSLLELRVSAQLGRATFYALNWASQVDKEIWFVTSTSPFEQNKIRPIERYLTTNFYPVEEITISERARAIRFTMQNVNEADEWLRSDIVFDDQLALVEYALPAGATFQAGDVIPVSIRWEALTSLPDDYQVSLRLVAGDGYVLTQRDTTPMGTFGRMSEWQTSTRYQDNHGLLIPAGAFTGDYTVQVVVYRWQDGARLPYRAGSVEGDSAVLTPITITD